VRQRDSSLRRLADGGVLLTSRAQAAGWPRRSLLRALKEDGWTRLQAGAWAEPGRSPDLFTRLRAVQLLKPQLVVSHRSAASLWRIETLDPAPGKAEEEFLEFVDPELTLRRAGKGKGTLVHRMPLASGDHLLLERPERQRLRVTSVPRTLADLLRAGPRDHALAALESALTRRRTDRIQRAPLTSLAAVATALETMPLQGAARARDWLRLSDPRAGSPAETIARLRMHDADLHPESQAGLRTPDGSRRYLDFLFRGEGLAVEIEGYAYHGTRDSHRRDIARFNQVLQCPEVRLLLRFTAADVFYRPGKMIEEIRAALSKLRDTYPGLPPAPGSSGRRLPA